MGQSLFYITRRMNIEVSPASGFVVCRVGQSLFYISRRMNIEVSPAPRFMVY